MRSLSIVTIALSLGFESVVVSARAQSAWTSTKFKSFVAFGDSYTDEQRLGYFVNNNGNPPPVGTVLGQSLSTSTGGRVWDRYVATYGNLTLYDYGISGAVCSNAITPRYFASIKAPFPAVKEYEIPAFIADSHFVNKTTNKSALDIPDSQTVYAIWIGTNDVGNYAFLTDSQVKGYTLVDYVNCVYEALDSLYKNGAKYFVVMNLAPLQLLPQYALPEAGGRAATRFWPDKGSNLTEISYRMLETVATVNDIYAYKTAYEVKVANRYPGAEFALFDTSALLTDMYNHPSNYLNGTAPLNVTGFVQHCDTAGANCVLQSNPDSFLWFDELHPSEQTDRQIARAFLDVISGTSKWATYWSG